jgi:hypothetical protein
MYNPVAKNLTAIPVKPQINRIGAKNKRSHARRYK